MSTTDIPAKRHVAWKKHKTKLLNHSYDQDEYQALRYYLIRSCTTKQYQPLDHAALKQLGYGYRGKNAACPSAHPWLANMRGLLRTLGSYKQLIAFLSWCLTRRLTPWRGYLGRFATWQEQQITWRAAKKEQQALQGRAKELVSYVFGTARHKSGHKPLLRRFGNSLIEYCVAKKLIDQEWREGTFARYQYMVIGEGFRLLQKEVK